MPESRKDSDESAASGRALWSGTITFGLVSVPVELFPATRATPLRTRMLAPDGAPLRRRYRCPAHDQPLESEEIVRGFDTGDGHYVVIEDEELSALAPKKSREIDLVRFVAADEIPPVHLDRTYVMVPAGDTNKAYRLLAAAMEASGLAGIATFVMRGHEYITAIAAEGGVLRAHTLRFADEVRSAEEVGLPPKPKIPAATAKKFAKLVATHQVDALDLAELDGDRGAPVRELAQQKLEAGEGLIEAPAPPPSEDAGGEAVVDLMHVLKQRLGSGDPKAPAAADSREELYERAKELGIRGRSKMNKRELARAIKSA